jgi:hypothetical protein
MYMHASYNIKHTFYSLTTGGRVDTSNVSWIKCKDSDNVFSVLRITRFVDIIQCP